MQGLIYIINLIGLIILTKILFHVFDRKKNLGILVVLITYLINLHIVFWNYFTLNTACYILLVLMAISIDFPKKIVMELNDSIKNKRFIIYLLSVIAIFFLLYIYLPVTIFFTSPEELKIHFDNLVKTNIKIAMIFVYSSIIFYMFLFSSKFKTILTYISLSLFIILIIYSYIYPFGYPKMNGLMFEQIPINNSKLILRSCVDLVTILCILIMIYFLLRNKKKIIIHFLVIINISLLAVVFTKVISAEVHYANKVQTQNFEGYPLKFSKSGKNVLILMLDRLMGGFVEKILIDDPSLYNKLDGFTWYPKSISPGINSITGVHALLGGYDYTPKEMNKRNYKTLLEKSTESFTILPYNFIKRGYEANLINPKGLGFTMMGDCDFIDDINGLNCSYIPVNITIDMANNYNFPTNILVESSYADLTVLLGIMRATPYAFKNVLNKKGPWKPFLLHAAGTTFKEWSELKALPLLSTNKANKNILNIFFNILPHEPYFMGKDCIPKKKIAKFSEDEYKDKGFKSLFAYQHFLTSGCTLKLLADYFDWMKINDIYDNTKIIIVSDHGILQETEDHSSRAIQGGTTSNLFVLSRSTLFVKDRNKRGKLKISEKFKPNAAVPEIVCEEIGGCVNPYLNNRPIKTLGRDDPFYVDIAPWQFNRQGKYKFKIQKEFEVINKDPYLRDNWRTIK